MSLNTFASPYKFPPATTTGIANAVVGALPVPPGGCLTGLLFVSVRNTSTGVAGGAILSVSASATSAGVVSSLVVTIASLLALSPSALALAVVSVSSAGVISVTGISAATLEWTVHFIGSLN